MWDGRGNGRTYPSGQQARAAVGRRAFDDAQQTACGPSFANARPNFQRLDRMRVDLHSATSGFSARPRKAGHMLQEIRMQERCEELDCFRLFLSQGQ